MKKLVIDFLIMVAFGTALYIDCQELAYAERGYMAYGGEFLIPAFVFIVWFLIKDFWYRHKAKEARKNARNRRRAQMRYEYEEE